MLNEVALLRRTNKMFISQRQAMQIVGGEAMLRGLVERGEVRAEKRNEKQNGRWDYNLWDCLQSCEIKRSPQTSDNM